MQSSGAWCALSALCCGTEPKLSQMCSFPQILSHILDFGYRWHQQKGLALAQSEWGCLLGDQGGLAVVKGKPEQIAMPELFPAL